MIIKENEAYYGVRLPIDNGKPLVLPSINGTSTIMAQDSNGSPAQFIVLEKPIQMSRDEIINILSKLSDSVKEQKGIFSPPVQIAFKNNVYIVNDLEKLWGVQDKDFVAAYNSAMIKDPTTHIKIEEEYSYDNRDF